MQSAQATQDPIRNLDFLRAVAVLMVVCAHFFGLGPDWLDKGFVRLHLLGLGGVMLFFVHTSLVLMMSLERMLQEARQNAQSWRSIVISFYIRRVFRIYPLSICIILLTVLLHIPQDPFFPYIKLSLSEVAANLLLVQNLTKMRDAIGPLWSLPWEVQMYVTLPFLFMLARTRKLWALALLGAAVVLVNAGGIAAGMRVVRIIDNVPCFLSGVLAYMLIRRRTLPKLPSWLWPVALAALIAAATLFGDWTMWKAYWGRWAVCLAVGLLIPQFRDLPQGWLSNLTHTIAKYSYGIYLFHLPIIWLVFDKMHWLIQPINTMLFVILTAAISVLAFHWIERPLMEWGKGLTQPATNFKPRSMHSENKPCMA